LLSTEPQDRADTTKVVHDVRDVLLGDMRLSQLVTGQANLSDRQLEPKFKGLVHDDEVEFIVEQLILIAFQASLER